MSCKTCRNLILKSGATREWKCPPPDEDIHRIQIGSSFTHDKKRIVVTGRWRHVYKSGAYMNYWHCESGGIWWGMIAEAYQKCAVLQPHDLGSQLHGFLKKRINETFNYNENLYLIGFSDLIKFIQTEGEFPDPPTRSKSLVVTALGNKKMEMHIHTSGASDIEMYLGSGIDFNAVKFENLRF